MATTPIAADVAVPTSGIARPIAVVAALGAVALAIAAASDQTGRAALFAAIVCVWGITSMFVAWRASHELTWVWAGLVAYAGALALLQREFAAAVPAAGAALVLTAPTGRVGTRNRWALLGLVIVAGAASAVALGNEDTALGPVLLVESAVVGLIAFGGFLSRYQRVGAANRARMQWLG